MDPKVYGKKTTIDARIVEIVRKMDDVLLFVEDTRLLSDKLKYLTSTIEEVLDTVENCCKLIHNEITISASGMDIDLGSIYVVY